MRANVRDITLAEPAMRDLDYQGLELPILTEQELLEQTWNLEEQPRVEGHDVEASGEREAEQSKRARDEEEGSESSRTKRPRVDVEVPQEETLNVATEPPEMPAAPVRSGEVPEVLVTPAVTELPKRRTSPQQLDLEQAALDPALVLPEPVPQDVAEFVPQDRVEVADQGQSPPVAQPDAPPADAPGGDFLQPLIPGGGPRREGRGKKKVNDGAQVDEVYHLRGQDIKVRFHYLIELSDTSDLYFLFCIVEPDARGLEAQPSLRGCCTRPGPNV